MTMQAKPMLTGEVPPLDYSKLSRWYVALRDESGRRRGLMMIDQQRRRTDQAMGKAFPLTATRPEPTREPGGSVAERLMDRIERFLTKIPSPYR